VADDDTAFLDILVKTFKRDFIVHAASDGKRALEVLDKMDPVAILVDEMMPHTTGTQVLAYAKNLRPNAARLLMTASTDFDRAVHAINQGEIHRFFAKPLRPMELRQSVVDMVQKVRAEALLRVELETLKQIRAPSNQAPSVLMVCANGDLCGVAVEACQLRGWKAQVERSDAVAKTLLANRSFDMLVIGRGDEIDARGLVSLARSVDESMAVVVLDGMPTVANMQEALALGCDDVLTPPFGHSEVVATRLERALHNHVVMRDMHRVTGELLTANRTLALQRRKHEEQQVKVLNTMVRALEARDAYTAGHTDRVAAISVRVAGVLGLSPERVEHVRVGALLHDIGKIGVRDSVLLKPGRLDAEEFAVIKTHATLGDSFLRDVDQFQCVAPIVRFHHERLDGSGYPDVLRGQDIPLEARIVAVADIMDAITSTRPYRSATHVDTAFEALARIEGTALDVNVCEALRSLHRAGRLVDLLQQPDGAG